MNVGEVEIPDYYARLGLTPAASPEDIQRHYRQIAKDFHPDSLHGGSERLRKLAEQTFSEATEAYKALSNAPTRKQYDDLRAAQSAAQSVSGNGPSAASPPVAASPPPASSAHRPFRWSSRPPASTAGVAPPSSASIIRGKVVVGLGAGSLAVLAACVAFDVVPQSTKNGELAGNSVATAMFLGAVPGGLAWILGKHYLGQIEARRLDNAGVNLLKSGKVCGMVTVGVCVAPIALMVLGVILILAIMGAMANG